MSSTQLNSLFSSTTRMKKETQRRESSGAALLIMPALLAAIRCDAAFSSQYSLLKRKLLLWYFFYNFLSSRGEWIELPKVNPSSKEQKKNHNPPPSVTDSKPSISLDMDMEKILMEVHKTLAAEGRASINGKENFLKKLQSQLLSKIWGASSNIWSKTGVEARGHGHVLAFPSLEGALMTIAFLTFAVFLIKIVKQCLQGLQAGNNVVGIELPGTMVTPAKVVKHKRSIEKINTSKNFKCLRLSQLYPSKFCSPYE